MKKKKIYKYSRQATMLRYLRALFIIITGLFLFGCARAVTSEYDVKNPDFNSITFKKIAVFANFADIGLRKQTEYAFVNKLKNTGVNAVPSIELAPPVKHYTKRELKDIINKNNIDGILIINLEGAWKSRSYIPKMYFTNGNFYTYHYPYNTYGYYNKNTQVYGGYYIAKPVVKFQISLVDTKSGKTVWISSATTRGNVRAKYDTLVNSLAETTVKKLEKEHIIEQNNK